MRIIIVNFFTSLKISFSAIKNGSGMAPVPPRVIGLLRLKLSPSAPARIAVTGEILFTLPVQIQPNRSTTASTASTGNICRSIESLSSSMILRDAPAIMTFSSRRPTPMPAALPARVRTIYLERYRSLILPFLIPSAFKIPISRYSCSIVKDTVNLNTTSAIIISTILTTTKMTAMIMSIT